MNTYTESHSQRALMQWWRMAHRSLGVAHEHMLFAIPNGGARNAITGAILKAEGVRAGVSDLMLACSRGGYSGLFIEMKTLKGRVREEQKVFQLDVIGEGYWAVVARGWEQASNEITKYLKGPRARRTTR